ncbi:ribosomal protein L12E/L44/L45/RPP1/RPP2 [Methylobacterium sp. RAS18]|nr:ribosomal protein L12E/L44/L45/RPP1/RPP2 [Methylobacterium sp. RAS18]
MTPAATPEALVEAREVIRQSLKVGAPGLAEPAREAVVRSIFLKVDGKVIQPLLSDKATLEAALATATAEAARLRAEVEAKDRALKEERARRKAAVQSVREKAAALCDEAAAYFDRTTGHYDRTQAAGSYRATAGKIRLLTPDRTALARAATAGEGRSNG